ncbi:hypothetical protein [Prosthecochloris sp. ZM]|uniref:hypothetical protein n=1 Tax=Prosthecochloris sp. ZM TaxID=2283143 RepID=UPI001ABF0706|nr:hypothetical protein [Prosthecochloris sp. ZM]
MKSLLKVTLLLLAAFMYNGALMAQSNMSDVSASATVGATVGSSVSGATSAGAFGPDTGTPGGDTGGGGDGGDGGDGGGDGDDGGEGDDNK